MSLRLESFYKGYKVEKLGILGYFQFFFEERLYFCVFNDDCYFLFLGLG